MKKSNSMKTLAILLSLVIIVVGCGFSSSVISFADDLISGLMSNSEEKNNTLLQMKGDYVAPYGIDSYNCADITAIDIQKSLTNYSNVSVDKVGTNDSFALKINGSNADYAYIKIGDAANTLERDKTYVITMKLKKLGTVNSFNSGIHIVSGSSLTQSQVIGNSDIKEDEWTKYTFEYTPTARRTGWAHLYLKWDIAEDSSLYIDDYSITLKTDATGHNMTPIGNFDRTIYIDGTMDASPVENANYSAKTPEGMSGFELLKNEGFKGSYGAKLSRTKASIDAASQDIGYVEFGTQGVFANNTRYIVEFKAKKSAGISALNILFREKAKEHTVLSFSSKALDEYMSESDYVLYRVEYETDGDASSGKSRISFKISGSEGAYILIDDFSIYAADDAEKTSLIKNGDFDDMRVVSNDEAQWQTVKIPYVIEEYDCISNYSNEKNHLPVLAQKYNTAAIEKIGYDNSYGLKLVGDGADNTVYIKIGDAINQLKGGTEYKISMKVKKVGTVDSFGTGIVYDWKYFPNDFTADITDEWKEISFTITPENNAESGDTGWNHLQFSWKMPASSQLYIDDISIVATDDESAKNIYNKGAFDATAHEESPVDETELDGALYSPAYLESTPVESTVVENEGFRGSYALKMEGTGSQKTAKIRYDTRPGLNNYTEYYIEFKAKRCGNVSYFAAGIQEQWANHKALTFGNAAVVEERISDSFYNYYRVKYTTDGNALGGDGKGAWTFITFTYTADDDAYLLIDDIRIYKTGEEEPYETFRKGTFDYTYYDLKFDNEADGTKYVPRKITEYTERHNFYVSSGDASDASVIKENIDKTISIAEGEGVKESAALKIEGTGVTSSFKISANSLGELENSCIYKIGLKVKAKAEGNVKADSSTFFRYGLVERWTKHYTLNFGGDKFSECISDDYHYYQFLYETDNTCNKAWSYLIFTYNLPEGMSLYIDEIELIPVSKKANWITDADGNSINLFKKSSFDMKDLGQDGLNKSETIPEGVTPVLSYQYSTLKPYTVAVDDAPSGDYCLAFGFNENDMNGEHLMYITPSMPGESYKISFWVKVVGEVENASFYMSDGRWLNHTYGVDFSQYETGKWTKFELIYNDQTTPYDAVTYRRIKFAFEAPAGSGMLIDNISCVRVDCDYESFNVLGGGTGDFESSELYPEIAWSENKRFTYKEGE